MPKALITGITGQDGRYLAKYLHALGYEVSGLVHGDAEANEALIRNTLPFVDIVPGDLKVLTSLIDALEEAHPDEVYNFGAVSSVALSFQQPELTADVTGLGVLRLLEAIRAVGGDRSSIRLYQASSSEMFGQVDISPQNEQTPFHPRSPYGAAKVFGHNTVVNYREAYGLYAVSGICFNHESPLRPIEFVTRKVTQGVAKVILGLQDEIVLGNLDAQRDWGFAGDYVRAMWLMLQQPGPDDYVVATGRRTPCETWSRQRSGLQGSMTGSPTFGRTSAC